MIQQPPRVKNILELVVTEGTRLPLAFELIKKKKYIVYYT